MVDWETLRSACNECYRCPLGQTRTNSVFGVGNREADILFVGEGPGEQEDLKGEPFVGKAGQLLNRILEAAGHWNEQGRERLHRQRRQMPPSP